MWMLRSFCVLALSASAHGFSLSSPVVHSLSRQQAASIRPQDVRTPSLRTHYAMTMAVDKTESKPSVATETKAAGDAMKEIADPVIETECGADYVPLLTALKLGQWEEADQITRDMLIWIGGENTRKRGFVYFSEASKLPAKDMKTIDRLWTTFSEGKFGYSVQKQIWNSVRVKGDFNLFVQEIGWTQGPCGGCDAICSGCTGTLKRWTAIGAKGNEFVYDLKNAKKGHLPLTSALRGTYLLQNILKHPAFGTEKLKSNSGTSAVKSDEPLFTLEELRFPRSPYTSNKKDWDV
uniref:GUN4-like domain-containing protein n=1 Tax=Guillardia theta TaxID=55529 RepID=A0A7S4KWL7_GUITH|mmetsp:Transcript_32629/g.103319  ORF Transcript_32629/g.103319 Transcript_32629/m.103319 type:complete len:293 (+) Transcript_32629:128-1006(+)